FNDYVAIDRNERTYRLQTYFDGKKVIIPITLRLFTSKERKDLLRVLERETSSERFKVEYAAKVAREALIGSKPNLPIILLSAVALNHLVNDSVVIEKN
ncbi:MAG TPA: hypothetical protein VEF04_04660, partial [Blastocatellia bacterium]|nr:hypothetical protein [Blastocatellia bacterium]